MFLQRAKQSAIVADMETENQTPKKLGRPPGRSQFDALANIIKLLQPLSAEQRERVIQTATTWLAATDTSHPANQ